MLKQLSASAVLRLLQHLEGGAFRLTLWDGQTHELGRGQPTFHLVIKELAVISAIIKSPRLGFAEAYMAEQIEVEGDLGALIRIGIQNQARLLPKLPLLGRLTGFPRREETRTTIPQQKEDVAHHYDLGNDFYKLWLDRELNYSCAYFQTSSDTLDQAQIQKIDHSVAKLNLQPGESLLDVGSGWGALIIRAAQKYKVKTVGITLSKEQLKWTRERIARAGLKRRVSVEYMDYRELPKTWTGRFDKWISIGMFEHVGPKNYDQFMTGLVQVLKPGGLGLLHSIISRVPESGSFFQKYIFPGGYLPSLSQIITELERHGLMILDVENLYPHYALTLDRWAERFETHVDEIRAMSGERFVRMWRLYLRGAAEWFRVGRIEVVQILFSHGPAGLDLAARRLIGNCHCPRVLRDNPG